VDKSVGVTQSIAASPEAIYDLVSDLPNMGNFSPENQGGTWLGGATGPGIGATFKGTNRNGWRRWSTTVTITAADRGRRFAFRVSSGPFAVADWTYDLSPGEAAGITTVTETWEDRRPSLITLLGKPVSGVSDRASHNRSGMQQTLAAVRQRLESGTAASEPGGSADPS
jgi:hypothetical protein